MPLNVFSLRERRRPSRLKRRRWKKRIEYAAIFISAGIFLFAFLAYCANREEFRISRVAVRGNALIPSGAVDEKTKELLTGEYLGFFPKNNTFFIRKEKLSSALKEYFPTIESLTLAKVSFTLLSIEIRERSPYALWCGDLLIEEKLLPQPCYFLDKEGFIFTEAPDFSSGVYLTFKGRLSSDRAEGNFFLPPERFKEFVFFIQALKSLELKVQEVSFEYGAGNTEDYILSLAGGAQLLISGSQSLESTLLNISAFFNDPGLAASNSEFFERVDYVDFRFGNKVYYK